MQIYTSNLSRVLRHSAVITLFLLSSIPAFAVGIEGQENVSKTPSIQRSLSSVESNESENVIDLSVPPPSASSSVQAVDHEVRRLEEELKIAQLRRQLAEEKLAAEKAEKLTAQQYISPQLPTNPLASLLGGFASILSGGRSQTQIEHNTTTEIDRFFQSLNNAQQGRGWKNDKQIARDETKLQRWLAKSYPNLIISNPSLEPSSSVPNPAFQESEFPSSSSADAPRTYRTTGENLKANNKHSALSLQLPNKDLQDAAYELIVNHRTSPGKSPQVRLYDPKAKTYTNLGSLPTSSSFRDTIFNLSSWADTVRDQPLAESVIATYLSFLGGKSDIHSFSIQSSNGKTIKKVVFGDTNSESQSGVHVYAPETDQDANEWSIIRQ